MKEGRDKLKDKKLAPVYRDWVRWSAQLPILEFNLCWTNLIIQCRDVFEEEEFETYLKTHVLKRHALKLKDYFHRTNDNNPTNLNYTQVWDARWRGHWDVVTPG